MGFRVKNTTVRTIFELFCPHHCLLCGKLGGIVCGYCKNYNTSDYTNECLECGEIIKSRCSRCEKPYDDSWVVGKRKEGLGRLVDGLKYQSIRALAWPIAEMMDAVLPCLPENVVVVPVPTLARHVRERGLDHTWLMARDLAKMRGWRCQKLVQRVTNTVQVGSDARQRRRQAKRAYALAGEIDMNKHYVVLDDVCTTGASLEAVCEALRGGGAKRISVVVLAKAGN